MHYAFKTPDGGLSLDTGSAKQYLEETAISLDGEHPLKVIVWKDTVATLRRIIEMLDCMERDMDELREQIKNLPEETAKAVIARLSSTGIK